MTLMEAWLANRRVRRVAVAGLVVIVVGVGLCGWRIVADGSTVAIAELADGHRHLVVPLVLLAVGAAAASGSVAASEAIAGHSAQVATTFGSVRRGSLALVAVGGAGAAVLTLALGAVLTAVAAGMLHQLGGRPEVDLDALVDAAVLVARAAVLAGALGALAAALGLVLPGSPLPSVVSSLGVLAVEAALLPLSSGRIDLVASSLSIVIVGPDQAVRLGHDPSLATTVALLAVGATTATAAALAVVAGRLRPLPS